jgi:hypothetical protein
MIFASIPGVRWLSDVIVACIEMALALCFVRSNSIAVVEMASYPVVFLPMGTEVVTLNTVTLRCNSAVTLL